jgi:superfamily I DNA/RNA helicase
LLKEIFNKGIVRKFDKLIIDEGQDLIREEYLNLFDSMIHGGLTKGNWEIFGDFERQAIYSSISKDAMMSLINNKARTNPTYFSLRKNCRNTKQIAEETSMVSGFERPPHVLEHLEGISVQYLFYKDKFEVSTMLEEQINLLLQSGMRTNDIVVLSPRKYEYSSISSITKYPIREIRSLKEFVSDTNTIYFSTAHSFKGMESKYVIVIDVEDITSEKAKSILYIAMSRAKYGLIMFVAEEQRENYRLILQRNLS